METLFEQLAEITKPFVEEIRQETFEETVIRRLKNGDRFILGKYRSLDEFATIECAENKLAYIYEHRIDPIRQTRQPKHYISSVRFDVECLEIYIPLAGDFFNTTIPYTQIKFID